MNCTLVLENQTGFIVAFSGITGNSILADESIFPLFQFLILALVFFAIWKDTFRKKAMGMATVQRGPQSRESLRLGYAFTSVIVLQIVNSAEALKGYKTIISLLDMAALVYLAFISGWSRNRLLGIIAWWQTKPEE